MHCPNFARVWWYYDFENGRVVMGRLGCKSWSCPHCAKENMKMWRRFLNWRLRTLSDSWYSMTLTAPENKRGRIESYKALQHGIDVLIKRFRRAFGGIEYVRVYEKHPTSDALHAHFIIAGLADFVSVTVAKNGKTKYKATNFRKGKRGYWALRTFVKKTAHASGLGYIADCKPITKDGGAVRYVTEYMTKDAQEIDIRGLRHVQTTRRIGSPKQPANKSLYTAYRLSKRDVLANLKVLDVDTGETLASEFWKENNTYPHL